MYRSITVLSRVGGIHPGSPRSSAAISMPCSSRSRRTSCSPSPLRPL